MASDTRNIAPSAARSPPLPVGSTPLDGHHGGGQQELTADEECHREQVKRAYEHPEVGH